MKSFLPMLVLWLVGVVELLSVPVSGMTVVNAYQENLTYSGLVIERMEGFNVRSHPAECDYYKQQCHKFMKCFGNCEELLIFASELNSVNKEGLSDEQQEGAQYIKTNPCVGMFAFCLSVDYFKLASVLDLTYPDAF